MAIINNKRVSGKSWDTIDKTALRNRLLKLLEEGVDGAAEAIRECYAVIRGEALDDAPSQNWVMPHHELSGDTLILNRGGLIAAAAALAGARAEPDLTPEQMRQAARHILRHYRQKEVNLEPPESLLELAGAGEMAWLMATISGEMAVQDIPLNPRIDIATLKAGDDNPMEVIVEVPTGRSKRGWNYKPEALQKIVGEVMRQGLPGFLGHQKPEDVDSQFPTPVTHWVGALFRDGKAYFRGVIDKSAADLKRWIRAGAVRTVSIFGVPTLQTVGGETQVVDYKPLSIDWTPLGRAGMPTQVVAVGEIDVISNNNGGAKSMTLAELLAELRKLGVKPAQVIGEMGWDVKVLAKELGWKLDEVAGEIGAERWNQLLEAVKAMGEIAEAFAFSKDAKLSDLVAAVKAAREVQLKAVAAEHEKLVDKVVGEMVQAEAARPLVKRMLKLGSATDEAAIRKAIGEMLEQEDVKEALAGIFKDTPITPKADGREKPGSGVVVKRVAI